MVSQQLAWYIFLVFYFCTLLFCWTVHMNFHSKFGFCSSKIAELWVLLYFLLLYFVQAVHTNFHAKSGLSSSKKIVSYAQFSIWRPFCFLAAILFLEFVRTVHMNFHAKYGLCSSRNEWVRLNFAIWRPFCFLAAIVFSKKNQNSFKLSIQTSMQNLDSVVQEISELCSI